MNDVEEITDVAVVEAAHSVMLHEDPVENFKSMQSLVGVVASACTGPSFSANIQGKKYPTVQWWTTVGASLGMFPYEVWSKKIEDDKGKLAYESFVEVRREGLAITSASAICSTSEGQWSNRDEYAIKSMATTRATAKAYRLGLSFLAVLSGLEATPAEEVPRGGFDNNPAVDLGVCPEHNIPWRPASEKQIAAGFPEPWHKDGDGFCKKKVTVPPTESEARREAMEVLSSLFSDANERKAYIKDVLEPKQINHPDDITDDDWRKVKAAAEGDLAAMVPEDEQLDFDRE